MDLTVGMCTLLWVRVMNTPTLPLCATSSRAVAVIRAEEAMTGVCARCHESCERRQCEDCRSTLPGGATCRRADLSITGSNVVVK